MKLLNEILGTKYPIIQGGMANIATGEFAACLLYTSLQELMKNVMNGYKRYIIGNGILNLDKIGFSSYMESDIDVYKRQA